MNWNTNFRIGARATFIGTDLEWNRRSGSAGMTRALQAMLQHTRGRLHPRRSSNNQSLNQSRAIFGAFKWNSADYHHARITAQQFGTANPAER